MINKISIENSLFESWSDLDSYDAQGMQLYDVVLNVDIGKYKKGDKRPWAFIDLEHSILVLGLTKDLDNDKGEQFEIMLKIKD